MKKETFYLDEDIFGDFSNNDDYIKFWDKLQNDTIDMAHYILEYPIDQQMAALALVLHDLAIMHGKDDAEMKQLFSHVFKKVIRDRDELEREISEKLAKKQEGGD